MGDDFYDPGDQRAVKVERLFSRIARRYDLINDLQSFGLHRYWKRRLVRMAGAHPGKHALDVCCGTGDIALALARSGAEVVGLDFSERMLEVARARARTRVRGAHAGLANRVAEHKRNVQEPKRTSASLSDARRPPVSFVFGDAQMLPFGDASFDIVTVGYGLRNLASWERGLREMQRVTKSGGRLLVLDFGKPDNAVWRGLYFSYLRMFVPVLGLMFAGSARAYAYILKSLEHYPAQHGIEAKMRELGLANVQVVNFLCGVMSIHYGEKK